MIYLVWGGLTDISEWTTFTEEAEARRLAWHLCAAVSKFDNPRACRKWVLNKLKDEKKHIGRIMDKWYKCDWMDIRSQKTTADRCSKETTTCWDDTDANE
jgi:hypothetical protein